MKTFTFLMLITIFSNAFLLAQEKMPPLFPLQYAGTIWSDTTGVNLTQKQNISGTKSENLAFHLSFWSTAIPAVGGAATIVASKSFGNNSDDAAIAGFLVGWAGMILGPSVGYFYGGRPGRAFLGSGIRLGLTAGTVAGMIAICPIFCSDKENTWTWVVFIGGHSLLAASAIYDIATVKKAVRMHNEKLHQTGWLLSPKYFADHKAGGLELQITF